MSYLITKVKTNFNSIDWAWLDENDKAIRHEKAAACFGSFTGASLPKKAKTIVINRPVNTIPYSKKEVQRWINDLTEAGFPCSVSCGWIYHKFRFDLAQYTYKGHLYSALCLVRSIFEQGYCQIPDTYFQDMDKNPGADKFDMIQTAHKKHLTGPGGHHIIGKSLGKNVNKDTLFTRFKNTGLGIYDHGIVSGGFSSKWREGTETREPYASCRECSQDGLHSPYYY